MLFCLLLISLTKCAILQEKLALEDESSQYETGSLRRQRLLRRPKNFPPKMVCLSYSDQEVSTDGFQRDQECLIKKPTTKEKMNGFVFTITYTSKVIKKEETKLNNPTEEIIGEKTSQQTEKVREITNLTEEETKLTNPTEEVIGEKTSQQTEEERKLTNLTEELNDKRNNPTEEVIGEKTCQQTEKERKLTNLTEEETKLTNPTEEVIGEKTSQQTEEERKLTNLTEELNDKRNNPTEEIIGEKTSQQTEEERKLTNLTEELNDKRNNPTEVSDVPTEKPNDTTNSLQEEVLTVERIGDVGSQQESSIDESEVVFRNKEHFSFETSREKRHGLNVGETYQFPGNENGYSELLKDIVPSETNSNPEDNPNKPILVGYQFKQDQENILMNRIDESNSGSNSTLKPEQVSEAKQHPSRNTPTTNNTLNELQQFCEEEMDIRDIEQEIFGQSRKPTVFHFDDNLADKELNNLEPKEVQLLSGKLEMLKDKIIKKGEIDIQDFLEIFDGSSGFMKFQLVLRIWRYIDCEYKDSEKVNGVISYLDFFIKYLRDVEKKKVIK